MVVFAVNNIIRNIVEQLDIMSYLNVMSFSVLSGCGTSIVPSLNELDIIEELCKDMSPNQMPYNVFFMNSLHGRCLPIYAVEAENPYNLEGYKWIDKKRKADIDIEVMASSIICCCSLAERLLTNQIQLENNPFIAYLLFSNALHQGRFIRHHLKVGDLYYSGEDVSEDKNEPHMQIASKNPDRLSQFLVLQAFTMLRRLGSCGIPYMHMKNGEFEEDLDLLHPLYRDVAQHISEIKSRDLANLGLCIAGIYANGDSPCELAYKTLDGICSELQKRLNDNGGIVRSASDNLESSPATLFNTMNLLSQAHYMFDGKAHMHTCLKIYSRLNSFWDNEHGIFKFKDSNKQSLSIRDISASISSLLALYTAASDTKLIEHLESQIKALFETTFLKSKILNGQSRPILQEHALELPDFQENDPSNAPVFNKAFEYKISKGKFYCEADTFRSDYVLTSCRMLLTNISSWYM